MAVERPGQKTLDTDKLAASLLDDEELTEADKKKKEKEEEEKLSPLERWQRNLKAVDLSEEDAEAILDSMIRQGYWEREYSLFRGKLNIKLRTRDGYSLQRAANALDSLRTNDPYVYTQTIYRLNLAGSLVKYRDVDLRHVSLKDTDEERINAYNERLLFIDKAIPATILSQVYNALTHFDNLATAALSEGASSGF